MALRSLAADDIFISYTRRDASTYAAGLADELTRKGFSCFIDKLGTDPNAELPDMLKRKIRSCAMLVVVCTERAGTRQTIEDEITEFLRAGRRTSIVPVDFDEAVYKARWYKLIEGVAPEPEKNPNALDDGDPSPSVVSRIEKQFNYTRRNVRLRRVTYATATVLALLILASVVAGAYATRQIGNANEARAQAVDARKAATAAQAEAAGEKSKAAAARLEALDARASADAAGAEADLAKADATEQRRLATEAAADAREKTRLADEATRRADEQTQKAEAASRRAAAQEVVAHKNLARSFYAQAQADAAAEPLRALAWADSAVREAPAGDENLSSYVMRAVSLAPAAPLSVINATAGLRSAAAGPAGETVVIVNAAGRFSVWDARTGTPLPHPLPDQAADYLLDLTSFHYPVFSHDGRRIALLVWERAAAGGAGREPHLLVWEARTGAVVLDLRLEGWSEGDGSGAYVKYKAEKTPSWFSFSATGEELMVQTQQAGGVFVWDLATGSPRVYEKPVEKERLGHKHLAFSRDPARNWFIEKRYVNVATPGGGEIEVEALWVRDFKTGAVVGELTLRDPEDPPHPIQHAYFAEFTRDARKVVIFSGTMKRNTLRIWDVASGRVSGPAVVDKWEEGTSRDWRHYVGDERSISPDGRSVLLMSSHGDNPHGVAIWDISGDEPRLSELYNFRSHLAGGREMKVERSFYADDGVHVIDLSAEVSEGRELTVWDSRSGLLVRPPLVVKGSARIFNVSTRDMTALISHPDGTVLTFDLTRDGSRGVKGNPEQPPFNVPVNPLPPAPGWASVLTLTGANGGAQKKTLELRDPESWGVKWRADTSASNYNVANTHAAKFSGDGTHFVVLHESPTVEKGPRAVGAQGERRRG